MQMASHMASFWLQKGVSTEDLCYIFTQDSDIESELQLWT